MSQATRGSHARQSGRGRVRSQQAGIVGAPGVNGVCVRVRVRGDEVSGMGSSRVSRWAGGWG
jgi:hypothetical protein